MPQPDVRDLHVDKLLTNVSIGYRNGVYIADQLFPIVPVRKQSDIIPQYNQSFWFRDAAALRAPGTKSEGGGFTVDNTLTYFCFRYSFRFEIPDDVRDNADEPYNLDNDGTEFVTDKLFMRREVNFATSFFTTGIWGSDQVGVANFTQWDDYAGSTPLVDFAGWQDIVEGNIAKEGNTFILGKQVWSKLKWHPDLIDTIKYTQVGQMTVDKAATLFEIDRLLIGRTLFTTTIEGTAEASVSYTRIWGKNGLLLYVPASPSLLTPAAGYTFVWNKVPNALQYIKRMRDEEREVDILEGNTFFGQKVTAARAGLFASAVIG